MTSSQKPVLFLDFDRTLFDLDRFMGEYLGYRHEEHAPRFKEFLSSDPTTDISAYLYPETIPFLKKARETHLLVLLSRGRAFPEYQRKKILGTRIAEHLDDIIVTPNDDKGLFAMPFLPNTQDGEPRPQGYIFVDDNIEALLSMGKTAPYVRTILIDRRSKVTHPPTGITELVSSLSVITIEKNT